MRKLQLREMELASISRSVHERQDNGAKRVVTADGEELTVTVVPSVTKGSVRSIEGPAQFQNIQPSVMSSTTFSHFPLLLRESTIIIVIATIYLNCFVFRTFRFFQKNFTYIVLGLILNHSTNASCEVFNCFEISLAIKTAFGAFMLKIIFLPIVV